ncbi:MAG: aquaporin [Gemmataceae bacterium]|nr:aquaporin [Gemmataceae bacterium]
MDIKHRAWLAEIVGTYLVVLVGAGTLCTTFLVSDPRYLGGVVLAVALAEGFALAVAVSMTMHLSPACCNPAITLALWVTKRLEGGQAFLLGCLQLFGAFLAGLTLKFLFTDDVLLNARMGTPRLGALVGDGGLSVSALTSGIVLEALFAFLVTLAAYASLIDPRGPKAGGLLVGMAQATVILFGFHLTGGAANPARWAGTAFWQPSVGVMGSPLAEHPVYWIGPALGALGACVVYAVVIQAPEKRKG